MKWYFKKINKTDKPLSILMDKEKTKSEMKQKTLYKTQRIKRKKYKIYMPTFWTGKRK